MGYLPWVVNLLGNIAQILRNSRGDICEINFPQHHEKHDKSTLMEISQVFGTYHMLTVKAFSETALLREGSNQDFHGM